MQVDYEADTYFGQCSICGLLQHFVRSNRAIRETYRCTGCKASLREREQALSIIGCYGDLRANTFTELVATEGFRRLHIYEPGTVGPYRRLFKPLPHYFQSDYYDEADRAKATPQLPHQSLEALSYDDQSFDLTISSDILEHVRKPLTAFAELYRVLKPGGYNIFTVPLQEPAATKSVARVDTEGAVDVHILPEYYHGNGKGGRSLVYTDFGLDIVDMLNSVGFSAHVHKAVTGSRVANRIYTVIARRF